MGKSKCVPSLGKVGGREVGDDPLGRQRQAERRDRAAHPLAAFRDRLVGEADDVEGGKPGDELYLYLDRARLEPEIRHRRYARDHADNSPRKRCHSRFFVSGEPKR